MSTYTFSPEEITYYMATSFAAPLIISTIGWILYGVNLCQLVEYLSISAKRDHLFTKIWVLLVIMFDSASMFYQVYFNWLYSITLFTAPNEIVGAVNGRVIILYSVVVILVQFFWLSCIKKSMVTRPTLSWVIISPIALLSFASFIVAIAVSVFSSKQVTLGGSYPTPLVSQLLRVVLGLDLGVDITILIVLITQLTLMKRNTIHHKKTISKLSWILIGTTLASTLVVTAELVIEGPRLSNGKGAIPFAITFANLIPPIYSFGFLSVLNSRSNLWPNRQKAIQASNESSKGLIPGMRFTVDLPDPAEHSVPRDFDLSNPTMTFVNTTRRE